MIQMKLTHLFFLQFFILLTVQSCHTRQEQPAEAVKAYFEFLKEGNIERFAEGIAFDEDHPEEQRAMLIALIEELQKESKRKNGDITSFQITSEAIQPDGIKANVTLLATFENNHEEELTINVIKKEGKWKMELLK